MIEDSTNGTLVLSLDTELAWGSVHHGSYAGHEQEFERTRYVVERLLDMFERYEVHATWAVVGKLMLAADEPDPADSGKNFNWRTEAEDHFWHAPDIVDQIRACPVAQEIGSHNYTHLIMGSPGASAEAFDQELKSSKAVAERRDIDLRSFVYPRNEVDHLDVLKNNGFTSYRGVAPSWTWRVPGQMAKRFARLADHLLPVPAPVVHATVEDGLVNIPASYSYLHRSGWARWVPISVRVRKSILTMRRAAREGGIFHLWTHPFNIASDAEGLLGGLERICQEYKRLNESGLMVSQTMTEVADLVRGVGSRKAELAHA